VSCIPNSAKCMVSLLRAISHPVIVQIQRPIHRMHYEDFVRG
jgi:hypothetical protein